MTLWPVIILDGAVGLCLGSFVTTAAIRTARNEPFLAGRSHCDACGMSLGFAETTPVAGYLLRAGACRTCGRRIDPLHLLGELLGALILAAAPLALGPVRGFIAALLAFVLLASSIVDTRTGRLPDFLTLLGGAACLALAATVGPVSVLEGLIAAGVTALSLIALRILFQRLRGDPGLGLGDVKLLGALALWLGAATPWAIVLAALAGLAWHGVRGSSGGRIAFGPFIAAGALVAGGVKEAGWPIAL
jgi:leader peptidase (prepilin peptidase)/N-methyltransferase